jgi:hypothetical protein
MSGISHMMLGLPPNVTGAAFFRAASTSTTGSTTITLPAPTGTLAGDLMFASVLMADTGNPTVTGWTKLGLTQTLTGVTDALSVYYRYFVAGDTSWTWTVAGSSSVAGGIASFGGVNSAASPIDGAWNSGAATPALATSITLTNTSVLIDVVGNRVAYTEGIPSGFLQAFSASISLQECNVFYKLNTPPGATGDVSSSISGTAGWASKLVSFESL